MVRAKINFLAFLAGFFARLCIGTHGRDVRFIFLLQAYVILQQPALQLEHFREYFALANSTMPR
jgi:hypothetical protein